MRAGNSICDYIVIPGYNSIVDPSRDWSLNVAAYLVILRPCKDSVDVFIHQLIVDVLSQLDRMVGVGCKSVG